MSREKRTANIQGLVFPSTKERMKQRVAELGAGTNVTSMSDYLFLLVERDLLEAETVQTVKQRIGVRIGRN